MDTTYSQKLLLLAQSLASAPADLPAYVAHWPAWGRRPTDLELPWFSYGAIRYLKNHLRATDRVFEFGSGGSTFFFARRTAAVLSVENDPSWQLLVSDLLRTRGLANASCELQPLRDDSLAAFGESPFSQRIRSGRWNVVIVDCHCGFQAGRYGLIRQAAVALAREQVEPGGFIVLDDSWMYPEALLPQPGWEVTDYRGVGPYRYGVTSTAIIRRTG
jgi:hypothetical protein